MNFFATLRGVTPLKPLYKYIKKTTDIFFPEECILCHKICNQCLCPECLSEFSTDWQTLNTVTTLSSYHDSPLRQCLHHIKFNQNRRLARWIGTHLAAECHNLPYQDAIWIPVPQHPNRLKQRGFNPLDDLFGSLIQKNKIKTYPIIQRIRDTQALHGLSRQDRFKCMDTAFGWHHTFQPHHIIDRDIVIYDDIYTTGSTMDTVQRLVSTYPIKTCYYVTLAVTDL